MNHSQSSIVPVCSDSTGSPPLIGSVVSGAGVDRTSAVTSSHADLCSLH